MAADITKASFDKAFKTAVKQLSISNADRKVSGSRLEFAFPDSTHVVLTYATANRNLPQGEFVAYSVLSLQGGPVYQIMCDAHLEASGAFFGNVLVRCTSHNLFDPGDYVVSKDGVMSDIADNVVNDIRRLYFPIIDAFTVDYKAAIKFVTASRGKYVRNPFTTCVILLGLSRKLDEVTTLIATAKKRGGFYDLDKSADPIAQIVTPVSKCLALRERQGE